MNNQTQNSTPQTTMTIPNYQITETVYSGSRTIVYRAIHTVDQLPVVIKLLKNPYPTFSELVQFRNQYTIAKNLHSPLIIKTYSLKPYQNSYALVMEDFGGISLKEWGVGENLPSLQEFLEIAISLCDALEILYRERIIHKDIKPSNILINPQTKQVKLIDFSIASLLPRETETLINPNVLEGTLAYISPEQTGRMNRGIDYRTDFYSLGVTFYELLTGELPFQSNDLIELVHYHIAKMPEKVTSQNSKVKTEEIPEVISDIVMKLMAKNAEARYQTACGLKFDLEQSLTQLQQTGKIAYFQLGKRDIADRFIIPEKLYGREKEVEILLDAFERVANGTTELMLVAGFSGIGKTAVVNEVHKPIVRQRGDFIKGKYDQFNRNIPFSAFVQAFRDLMGQLLSESDAQLQTWKTQILNIVGDNGQVLIDVIPELENIIGKQPPAIELSGIAAQNRFNLLFQKFVKVFTSKEHPLVIFLDDLQWADSASLNLLKLLMQDTEYLLLLGAYRDNEVSPVHPLILTVDEIVKTEATVNTITLPPLTESDLNQLVADTLNCELSLAQPLTKLVYQKTQGNPFFATQFLKALYDDKLITFNWEIQHWQCDIAQVKALAITDDVVEFMALQLQKLPTETQELLKLAACIGADFDLNTLAIVREKSPQKTATGLWKALQEGLVIPTTKIYKFFTQSDSEEVLKASANPTYRFLHDRVQQAAYSLIPAEQKQATHLQIGKLLQQNLSETEKEEKLFDIVGHFNIAISLITQPGEREALARLNLAAGQKARNSTAYSVARTFVQTGLELLLEDCWQTQYQLTLNLYVAATETAYLNADFESMEKIASLVLRSAKTILDKVKIYEILINARTTQSQMLEAIAVGKIALTELGIEFSSEANETLTQKALQTLAEQLQGKEISELVNLPVMSDDRMIAAMQLLAMLFLPIFTGNPTLLPLLCSTMVSLSLKFGNTAASTIGYAGYGMVLSAFLGEVEAGYSFGRVALILIERLNGREFKSPTLLFFAGFLQHRLETLRATIPTGKEGYLAGMEMGDFLYAGYNITVYFDDNLFAGADLDDWTSEIENYCVVLAQAKQDSALAYLLMKQQTVDNWREIFDQPDLLIGTAYDETLMIPKYRQDNELTALAFVYIYKLMLAYSFGNYTNALEYIGQANLYLMAVAGTFLTPVFHFYAGLTHLALINQETELLAQKPGCPNLTLAQIETHQTTLAEWANYAPMNHQHKVDLLEAEKCLVLGHKLEAIELYDKAIALAKKNEYMHEEALANELAAKFYLNWGKEKIAAVYMQEAYYCYARWGAKAKVINLEQNYPQLLAPILQQPRPTDLLRETIPTVRFGNTLGKITSTHSSSSISEVIDLATMLKASQAISGEIELNKLLTMLLEIVIANAGADKCVLLLKQENDLKLVGLVEVGKPPQRLPSIALSSSKDIPLAVVNHVKRTLTPLVVADARIHPQFIADSYLQKQQPKSVFCSPILNQGQLIGILYLENNLTVGAFTSERVEVLNVLASQAAISIENAQLYERSLEYSQQLEQSLNELSIAESNLRASQQRLQLLVQQTPLAVIEWDLDFHITDWNPAAERIFGYTKQEALGRHFQFIVPQAIQTEIEKVSIDIILQRGGTFNINENVTKDGKTIICAWYNSPLVNTDGELIRVASIADDITDRKKAELALQQKSQDLEQALSDLQQAQLQIVQSEKMSALGNLVAGVAHEINNPVGFLGGNIPPALDYINDLFELLDIIQRTYPELDPEVEEEIEAIELDYIREDLPKLVSSMQEGVKRIQEISTSLRTFSRADKDYPVACNIHEGIDSTIMILKHRLKANEKRPEILVIKNYGNLPQIECYAGQLNQVFMNILSNAIDAFEESNEEKSFDEIKANPNQINIKTSVENHQVKISIADNGQGMNEEVKAKIFDHLFTTKAVGKGTGLGLAIARQIIVEKHGGEIQVNSLLGAGTEFIISLPIERA